MKTHVIFLFIGFIFLSLASCSIDSKKLFRIIPADESNLVFNNQIIENDSLSILDNEFFYNGAGIALGDLNSDGLLDVFLAGNQVNNKLFLNQGKFKFEDKSELTGIQKKNPLTWSSGVNIIDINADGLLDIYISNTLRKDDKLRENLLYINQGNDSEGTPSFTESGEAYGLNDSSYSSHAQFFDFDNDGDLDVFIGVNRIDDIDPNVFQNLKSETAVLSRDKLFENKGSVLLGHPFFEDISKAANINLHGFSHSTLVQDFNQDGLLDLYVSNDYLSNDIVYINEGNKTFTNKARDMFKHFSLSSMGSDLGDVNNDGKLDLFVSEMQPYYNKRKKLFQKGTSYTKEILTRRYDYEYQYPRNVLQLNQGMNLETGLPIYSEIGMSSGVAETDWSWASLFADFDNDGWSDLLIFNGFPKDVIDKDFGDFRVAANRLVSREKLLAVIPQIKVANFAFKNSEGFSFTDVSFDWGMDFSSYTNGAAYGDLDNDGDLDLILNNINDNVTLLENKNSKEKENNNFIRFKLEGEFENLAPYGSQVKLYSNDKIQTKILLSGRGYLSQPESTIHFGMGMNTEIDSIQVIWSNGKTQTWPKFKPNDSYILKYDSLAEFRIQKNIANTALFEEVSSKTNLIHTDQDDDFVDFNIQITIPHKFSQFGPSIAVGDLNGDKLEDVLIGGSKGKSEVLFYQKPDGTFYKENTNLKRQKNKVEEDAGIALFDIENDGDLDLYIAHGSAQFEPGSIAYDDVIWINDGKGNFTLLDIELPNNGLNASCVKAADFDHDGDLDLFIGNRVIPGKYPVSGQSYLLENKSTIDKPMLVDCSEKLNIKSNQLGLVTDAIWTDFNNDGWSDLIVSGEWMPILFFENKGGSFEQLRDSGIDYAVGWWSSLSSSDVDNDGDLDFIAGNFGINTFFRGNKKQPLGIIAKDFDNNGSVDPFISYYIRDSLGQKKNYLYHPWEDVIKQFRALRKSFNSYGSYGEATLSDVFENLDLKDALIKNANWMETSWVENLGNNKFEIHKLPIESQWAPVYGISTYDVNNDGYQDILMVGNDYGVEVGQGRLDALQGLVLLNNQDKTFSSLSIEESNFIVSKDAKSLAQVTVNEKPLFIATQNNEAIRVFSLKQNNQVKIGWNQNEESCLIYLNDTEIQKRYKASETSFQSQSSSSFWVTKSILKIEFYDNRMQLTRTINKF